MKNRRGRPHRCRAISVQPAVRRFKPAGVPSKALEKVVLTLDEMEAIRLADLEGMYHNDAAAHMQVSRQTFGRILEAGRRAVAQALVHGKELVIEGGTVMEKHTAAGPGGQCICPACGEKSPHAAGTPCRDQRCPSCGKRMLREGSEHHRTIIEKNKGTST